MNYIAFFDLDHTILNINSGVPLFRKAYKKGVLSGWKLITASYLFLMYRLKLIGPLTIIEKFPGWLTKFPVHDFEDLCFEVVEIDLIPTIRPQIINEIQKHREKGAGLVLLSSSTQPICAPMAKHLGMHAVICSHLEQVNDYYTGNPKGKFCFGEEKLNRMNAYLNQHSHSRKNAFYYGDSMDDLPVLKGVGHPVCVNPDKRLKKIAMEQNWVIHLWN